VPDVCGATHAVTVPGRDEPVAWFASQALAKEFVVWLGSHYAEKVGESPLMTALDALVDVESRAFEEQLPPKLRAR